MNEVIHQPLDRKHRLCESSFMGNLDRVTTGYQFVFFNFFQAPYFLSMCDTFLTSTIQRQCRMSHQNNDFPSRPEVFF